MNTARPNPGRWVRREEHGVGARAGAFPPVIALDARNRARGVTASCISAPSHSAQDGTSLNAQFCPSGFPPLVPRPKPPNKGSNPYLPPNAHSAEAATAHCTDMVLCVCLSYGGRQDIARAAAELCRRVQLGELQPEQVRVGGPRVRVCLGTALFLTG